jgi:hypothetical protein
LSRVKDMSLRRPFGRVFRFISLVASFVLLLAVPAIGAKVIPGSTCSEVNKKEVYKGKLFTCIKKGSSKIWDAGNSKKRVKVSISSTTSGALGTVSYTFSATGKDVCLVSVLQNDSVSNEKRFRVPQSGTVSNSSWLFDKMGDLKVEVDCDFSGYASALTRVFATTTPTPAPSSSAGATPKPSTSTSSYIFPILSETYFGKVNLAIPQFDYCWFAKKASNPSNQITPAVRQVSEVIGPDGLVKGSVWWMIPSLLPGESGWFSLWFADISNRGGCAEMPSRTFDKSITLFSGGSILDEIVVTTLASEKPRVLGVVQSSGKSPGTVIHKLRVLNQSSDKEIREDSFINFIFLDSSGKPIWAQSGRISGKVPPKGEALLSGSDFEIVLPAGTATVVGSLNFVLCKDNVYPTKDVCSY